MQVPEGWSKSTIGNLCEFVNGNGFKPSDWSNEGLPIIRIQNLNGSKEFNYYSGKPLEKWLVEPGQLLFAWAGTKGVSFGPKIWNGPQAVLNQHIFKLNPIGCINSFWFYKTLIRATQKIESYAHGFKATLLHVHKSDITEQVIFVPPFSEQQKIAQILFTWDKATEKLESLITAKQKRKKALMQQLLTGKMRFPGFSREWKETRLKRIVREEKSRNKDCVITRVLSVTNRSGFVLPKDQFSRQVASDDLSNYKIVRKSQFGYNPSRINVGSFARLDNYDEGVLSPMYIIFSINEKNLDSDFFINWMGSHEAKQRIASSTQGSVRDSVGFDALGSFPIILPPLDEQQKIAALLSVADKEITIHQNQLAALKQQKTALMQQLLTGKKRVQIDQVAA
jgi:type I restriction enzyme S subunit